MTCLAERGRSHGAASGWNSADDGSHGSKEGKLEAARFRRHSLDEGRHLSERAANV